ncbi:MAG: hypothetical protein RIB60_09010 [Phycisphaerales bacterium]
MTRRAVLLLEILLSLAVLAAGMLAVGAAVGRTTDTIVRADERVRAADAAWSAIALIEAGIATPESLNGTAGVDERTEWQPTWEIQIDTQRSEHAGLTLVIAEARRSGSRSDRAVYTARQLVRLQSRSVAGGWSP